MAAGLKPFLRESVNAVRGHIGWPAKVGNCHTYFTERVRIEDRGHDTPCWIWQQCVKNRYGWTRDGYAHRLAYAAFVGEISSGLEIDHLCRVTVCCNPDHLEAVTKQENLARLTLHRRQNPKTVCKRGHEIKVVGRNLQGHCNACANALKLEYKRRVKELPAAARNAGGGRQIRSDGLAQRTLDRTHVGTGL